MSSHALRRCRYTLLFAAALALVGCGGQSAPEIALQDDTETGQETVEETIGPEAETPVAKDGPSARGADDELQESDNEPFVAEPAREYAPPFADRIDLFTPPQVAAGVYASGERDETGQSVVLLGFANLDQPKVVLQINGVITPLADGEEELGVRVISVAPPEAVLQRGRTRWTASIR